MLFLKLKLLFMVVQEGLMCLEERRSERKRLNVFIQQTLFLLQDPR